MELLTCENQELRDKIKAEVRVEMKQQLAEEREKKRKREDQEEGQEDEKEEGEEEEDDAANPAKRQKLVASANSAAATFDAKPMKSTLVEELEGTREGIQKKMEALSEKKSEMFWLLKQVIMQETKQKMERAKQQKLEAAKVGGGV